MTLTALFLLTLYHLDFRSLQMNKDKGAASCIKRGFPISCVWFGAIVGPSLLSGVYAPVYLSPYGAWAVVLPIIMEIPICILAAMSAGIVAKHKTYDYASLGRVVCGKWFKYMIVFLDYYIILSFIIGGASVATIEGSIGAKAFGCSEFVGGMDLRHHHRFHNGVGRENNEAFQYHSHACDDSGFPCSCGRCDKRRQRKHNRDPHFTLAALRRLQAFYRHLEDIGAWDVQPFHNFWQSLRH